MKLPSVLIVAWFVAGLVGCDSVTLDGPTGEPLTRNDVAAFAGLWTNDESEVFDIRLTKAGTLSAGTLQWSDKKQKHTVNDHVVDVRRVGDATYFLVSDDKLGYGFVRIKQIGESQFQMLAPDPNAFRTAVEEGKLDGKITPRRNDHFNVEIRADSTRTLAVLATAEPGPWYDDQLTQTFSCIKRFDKLK